MTDPATTHPPRAAREAVAPSRVRMRIALASDHAGYPLKEEIKALLSEHDLTDFGAYSTEAADLPDHVHPSPTGTSTARSSSTASGTAAR